MDIFKHWESIFDVFVRGNIEFDAAHDIEHIKRVVKSAKKLCEAENGEPLIVLPAAWLHDCVNVAKESDLREQGSKLSADRAIEFLTTISYPEEFFEAIHHAIHAHSFSANIDTLTLEAEIVQDADRIDALGALGLARCLAYSAKKDRALYDSNDPFAENRAFDESKFAIDHFETKLLRLSETMKTKSGNKLAEVRTSFLKDFLSHLKTEIA